MNYFFYSLAFFLTLYLLQRVIALLTAHHRSPGETVALDDLTLYSEHYRLTGRPDRIVKIGEHYIPEEWKSGTQDRYCYRVQLGVYMLLVEEHYGIRPPYGILRLGKYRYTKVANTNELRADVMLAADQIRRLRAALKRA